MLYILSKVEYSTLLVLSKTEQNSISCSVYETEISKSDFSSAKTELFKMGLVRKGVPTIAGLYIAQAIQRPQKVVSVISCNSIDMASVHYCHANNFWVRILPNANHSIITIETPILEDELIHRIRYDFFGDMSIETASPIDVTLSPKEIMLFEMMQLAQIDRVRKKGTPLNEHEQAFTMSEFINRKYMLAIAASALMLGEKDGHEISGYLWESPDMAVHLNSLVKKNIFIRITEPYSKKQKYMLTQDTKNWLSLDCVIDKLTIQKLPQGDVVNLTVTTSGLMSVSQDKQGLRYKTVKFEDLY